MRVNILNNNVISIDFDTVDQVIDFIKKFNSSNSIIGRTDPIKIDPNDWAPDTDTFKIADPVPNPYTVTANIK